MTRWVLLRGLTREAGHWGAFPALMRERTGDEVLCLDLPGCGGRNGERSPSSVDRIARDVLLRLPPDGGPTVLFSLSLGAMVALACCRAAAGRVAGCVLVNTSAGGGSRFTDRLRPANYRTLLRLVTPGLGAMGREARVLAMTSARASMHEHVLADWARMATTRPVSRANAVRQLWAATFFRAGARPSVPMLLLASRGDALVSPDCSRLLAAQWKLPLREHPWAGHDLPLDDPAWAIDEAAAWWAGVAR